MENRYPTEKASEEGSTEKYIFPIVESEKLRELRENERKIKQRINHINNIASAVGILANNTIPIPINISAILECLKKSKK